MTNYFEINEKLKKSANVNNLLKYKKYFDSLQCLSKLTKHNKLSQMIKVYYVLVKILEKPNFSFKNDKLYWKNTIDIEIYIIKNKKEIKKIKVNNKLVLIILENWNKMEFVKYKFDIKNKFLVLNKNKQSKIRTNNYITYNYLKKKINKNWAKNVMLKTYWVKVKY